MRLSPSLITWLRCFEAAARHGSFTRAAADLHLTQSAISQQVRHLERHLECRLFHRFPGRLELSHYGRQLYAEISPALKRIEQAVQQLRAPTAPLYVSCSSSFATRWLMPRLGRFLRLHPDIDLHLRAEFHALSRDTFINEGLHAAIRYDPLEYPDLVASTLMEEYLLPVVSREFADLHAARIAARDFSGMTLLHDTEPWDGAPHNVEWRTILAALGREELEAYKNTCFNMAELALASARAGEGIAAARLALAIDDLEAGRLVPIVETPIPANSRYVFLSLEPDDPRVRAFHEWLSEECESFSLRCRALLDAESREVAIG
ncbi:MAG TPA: LysR substrate-binding domain-containing protein [Woeseiaceae bacterium]|nr:LysR substrate-binding domain-containing protein [Woeseiaceae bacterium]